MFYIGDLVTTKYYGTSYMDTNYEKLGTGVTYVFMGCECFVEEELVYWRMYLLGARRCISPLRIIEFSSDPEYDIVKFLSQIIEKV